MLNRIRSQIGNAGLVVAVVALIVGLTGGAMAASDGNPLAAISAKKQSGLTRRQKREVRRIARRFQGSGPAGPQGLPGAAGPKGDTGANGQDGAQGPQGAQGPRGLQGDEGPQGLQGDEGPQGLQGDEGPQGAEGPEGPEGESVRAYATVTGHFNHPCEDGPEEDQCEFYDSKGVTSVTHSGLGEYCVTAPGISATEVSAVAVASGTGGSTAFAHPARSCASEEEFRVITWLQPTELVRNAADNGSIAVSGTSQFSDAPQFTIMIP